MERIKSYQHLLDDPFLLRTFFVPFQAIALLIVGTLAVVRCQNYGFGFGSPYAFSGGLDAPLQSQRDPRQNTGPVVFPPAPPDNGETSGVVVGASGFGFVPPGSSGLIIV